MMNDFDNVIRAKREKYPEFISIVKKLFGNEGFQVEPDDSYTIIKIIPNKTLQMKMQPFNIYWTITTHKDFINFKIGKDSSNYSKYKWNLVINHDVQYIIESDLSSNFYLIKVNDDLINKLLSMVNEQNIHYNNNDTSLYYSISLSQINKWIIYSSYNIKPVFKGSSLDPFEKNKIISIFQKILLDYEKQAKWAVKNVEILEPSEKIVEKEFFVPLSKYGSYYSIKTLNNLSRTILQNDLWNYLRSCYSQWNIIVAIKYKAGENLYYLNKSANFIENHHGNIRKFEL